MSTRSSIGYIKADGTVSAVYVHWDGYPDYMRPAIQGFLDHFNFECFRDEIHRAQKEGGFRSVYESPKNGDDYCGLGETFDDSEPDMDWRITERDDLFAASQEYAYLVREGNPETLLIARKADQLDPGLKPGEISFFL